MKPSNSNLGPLGNSPKHRILFLQSTSLADGAGGVQYYLEDLASLARDICGDENVWVMAPYRSRDNSKPPSGSNQIEYVPFRGAGLLSKLDNRFSPSFFQSAKERIRKFRPTLLVCGHVSLGPLVYLLSRQHRVPMVSVAYGIESWGNLWPQDNWAQKHSDAVISISQWTKDIIVKRGIDPNKIGVIAPHLPAFYEDIPIAATKNSGPFTLLTVSRLDASERYKGHDDVLEACAWVRRQRPELEFKYIIMGEGSDRVRLRELAQKLKLSDVVEFKEAVDKRADLAAVYQNADVFVMPAHFGKRGNKWSGEGFGIVYTEAAVFGLPSIAYDCGGATDIIDSGRTGYLVPEGSIETIGTKLIELIEDREKVRKLGAAAQSHVWKHFSRAVVGENLRNFLALHLKA